jgi:N-acetylglutamate synthase-like GNAT family acetyltransferase/thioredoxin reductase
MTTISLRPAKPSDWAAIELLLAANRLPLAGARDHLETFLVAADESGVVGCAGVEVRGEVALLRSVAVAPSRQGQGIGRQMVGAMLAQASSRGIKSLALLTTTARDWFKGFGFRVVDSALAPAPLRASAEFQGACPASAEFLMLELQAASGAAARLQALPVAVLGAGPVGLAAAAQLIERGIPFFILETGSRVGSNLLDYGHVRLFSPWRYNASPAMVRLLEASGWTRPADEDLPLAAEVVSQLLEPFARLPQVANALHLSTRVLAVTREGFDKVKSTGREAAPFIVRALHAGKVVEYSARAVIDSTGTWNQPNPLGAGGLAAQGEEQAAGRIFYGIPDVLGAHRARYAGKRTLVVGAGHSAANTLLALAQLALEVPATELVWSVRSPVLTRVFGGGEADALSARGALGSALKALRDSGAMTFHAGLRVTRIEQSEAKLSVIGVDTQGRELRLEGIDEIVCATGQRPDLDLTRELRVKLDPWLECNEALGPLIDPNLHSCGTVRPHGHRELGHPETGLYTVGVKSYGRAPTFLMATGFEQVRSVVAALAGDLQAADRVELDLPETGVCSVSFATAPAARTAQSCGASAATSCSTTSCSAPTKPEEVVSKAASCGVAAKSTAASSCGTGGSQGMAASGCGPDKVEVPELKRAAASCC